MQGNFAYVLNAVQEHGCSLRYASSELQNNESIVTAACLENGRALKYASLQMKNSKNIVLAAINKCPYMLEYASDELKNDREVVLAAVNQDGQCLLYSSPDLKNDYKVALNALKTYYGSFKLVSDSLKNKRSVVLAAVTCHWSVLGYASERFKADKEIVLAAVKQDKDAFQYASPCLKKNRNVVKEAVQFHWGALKYASKEMKDDKEIVLIAVAQHGAALMYASERLKNEKDIVLAAILNHWSAFNYMADKFKEDREIVLMAVGQSPSVLLLIGERRRTASDRELIIAATKGSATALQYASPLLKNDLYLGMIAYSHKPAYVPGTTYIDASEGCSTFKQKVQCHVKHLLEEHYPTPFRTFLEFLIGSSRVLSENIKREKQVSSSHSISLTRNAMILQQLNRMNRWSCLHVKKQIAEYAGVRCLGLESSHKNKRDYDECSYAIKVAKVFGLCLDSSAKCDDGKGKTPHVSNSSSKLSSADYGDSNKNRKTVSKTSKTKLLSAQPGEEARDFAQHKEFIKVAAEICCNWSADTGADEEKAGVDRILQLNRASHHSPHNSLLDGALDVDGVMDGTGATVST